MNVGCCKQLINHEEPFPCGGCSKADGERSCTFGPRLSFSMPNILRQKKASDRKKLTKNKAIRSISIGCSGRVGQFLWWRDSVSVSVANCTLFAENSPPSH